ncbi:MAG: hypothetical protein D6719_08220 [Candidatus Dadabacteria bacterium]|nr:MAG: hypothetical protein D6719_08220 [Candidatus Dadabacteria bacterium]
MSQKINALIVHENATTRVNLKTATTSVYGFKDVRHVGSPHDALIQLNKDEEPVGAVFVARSFGKDVVSSFIANAKGTTRAQDAAFILILEASDQDSAAVTASLVEGGDGFLFEPFSVDTLKEITELAIKIRNKRLDLRERAAFKLLADDAVKYIDKVIEARLEGRDPGYDMKMLRKTEQAIANIGAESMPRFFSELGKHVLGLEPVQREVPDQRRKVKWTCAKSPVTDCVSGLRLLA